MRYYEIMNEAADKFWLNVATGQAIECTRAHGDVVADHPERFGISAAELSALKQANPDDDHVSWWEMARYVAEKRGWVRIGGAGAHDGFDNPPYIYAASLAHAQKAVAWCIKQGLVLDELDIEVNNPDEPVEGSGDFYQLRGQRVINVFMRTGRIVSR